MDKFKNFTINGKICIDENNDSKNILEHPKSV